MGGLSMGLKKRKRVIGILVLAVGIGILLAITVPYIGWIVFSAICLIAAGVYLLKFD
jgi:hypothetical protein